MLKNSKFLVFDHAKLQEMYTKALSILVLFATTYFCKPRFSSLLHLKRKYQNHLTPQMFAHGSE